MRQIYKVFTIIAVSLGGMLLFVLLLLLTVVFVIPNSTTHMVMEWVFAVAVNLASVVFGIALFGLIYTAWRGFNTDNLLKPITIQDGAYFLAEVPHEKSVALLHLQGGGASGLTLQQANSQPISVLPVNTNNHLLDFPAPVEARDEQLLDVFFRNQQGEPT